MTIEVYEAEIEARLDEALEVDGVGGRYAALLHLYLTLPSDRTDLLFVAIARRLALVEVSAWDAWDQAHETVEARQEAETRRAAQVERHRSTWRRLTDFLPRRVRS